MLKNYIKVALRNISKKKAYSIINISGLGIALACCLLITLYVIDELSYDKFHTNVEEIHRVEMKAVWGGTEVTGFMTPTALLPNIMRTNSSVKGGTRTFRVDMFAPEVVSNGTDTYQEKGFYYVDSTFFDVFDFELIQGDKEEVLKQPNSLVLTESSAFKYFGSEDPMGELLNVGSKEFKITGIAKDVPSNSHFHFDMLGSFSSIRASKSEIWGSANYSTYLRIDPAQRNGLSEDITKMVFEQLQQYMSKNDQLNYHLTPITDIHLYSEMDEFEAQGDIRVVIMLGFIGLLILTIGCINYMNLATARSIERSKEVGMRKTLGAQRFQLFYQFMGESFVITFFAMVLAILITGSSLPAFNLLTDKSLTISALYEPLILLSIFSGLLLVTLMSGAYPSLVLSRHNPISALKGAAKNKDKGSLRKALVVVQFGISIFLIISTLIVSSQLDFMRNKKLGYDKENVLIIPMSGGMRSTHESIKNQLLILPEVNSISYGSDSPADIDGGYSINIDGYEDAFGVKAVTVDKDFISTMKIEILEGTDFTETDQNLATLEVEEDRQYGFIINEALLNNIGLSPEDALNKKANVNGRPGEIKAVIKNFHFASMHSKIQPLVLFIEPAQFNHMLVRLNAGDPAKSISAVRSNFSELVPGTTFSYQFLDQEYAALYSSEQRLQTIFTLFSTVAIVIACLGLFGLISFTTTQRAKEIGIRKVMGASASSIVMLITRDYAKLIVVAVVIAIPLGYYGMQEWLLNFEYRISVGIIPFLNAVIISFIIAFATIANHALRSAFSNPATTLKNNE